MEVSGELPWRLDGQFTIHCILDAESRGVVDIDTAPASVIIFLSFKRAGVYLHNGIYWATSYLYGIW